MRRGTLGVPWFLGAGRISQSALVDYDILEDATIKRTSRLLPICEYLIVYFITIVIVMVQNDQPLLGLY